MRFRYLMGLAGLLIFLLVGCSDQPNQKNNKETIAPNPASPSTPVIQVQGAGGAVTVQTADGEAKVYILDNVIGRPPTEIRDPRVTENSEDDKIETNGKKPVVFNGAKPLQSSVAGVSFGMSHAEASEILSTPIVGACGSSGDYYLENMCLLWSNEEPRRLRQVYLLDGYLGKIEFAEPIGAVKMKAELTDVFTEDMGEKGEELLRLSYNKFFEKEADYNCLETQDCQAVFYNDYINWIMPNLTVIFSKDRKVLIGLLINQDVQPGLLASPMDLVLGKLSLNEGGEISLGDSWSAVQEKLGGNANPPSIIETAAYRKDYVGMVARVNRAGSFSESEKFELKASEPKGEEPFTNLVVYANYDQPILLNGKYVKVSFNAAVEPEQRSFLFGLVDRSRKAEASSISLSLSEERPAPEESLSVRMPMFANDLDLQKDMMTQLAGLIKAEFEATNNQGAVSQRLSGFNAKQAPNRSLVIRTSSHDFKTGKSFFVYSSISVNTGNMVFGVSLDLNPINEKVMSSIKEPVDTFNNELAGFHLGEKVKLSQIDRSRGEAFLEIGELKIRVEVDLYGKTLTSFEPSVTRYQKIIFVGGLGGAAIGLNPTGEISQKTQEVEAEIVYISSSMNPIGFTNICGMSDVFDAGMTQKTFDGVLRAAVLKTGTTDCVTFAAPDTSGDGEARTYFFPQQGAKIYFVDRVLTGVAKYRRPGQFDLVGGQN